MSKPQRRHLLSMLFDSILLTVELGVAFLFMTSGSVLLYGLLIIGCVLMFNFNRPLI